MKTGLIGLSVAAAMAASVVAAPAIASVYVVSASGLWSAEVSSAPPTTIYSVAGESFSFSFTIPNPFPYITTLGGYAIPNTVPATEVTNFSYTLNGQPVATTLSSVLAPDCNAPGALCSVVFFSAAQGGGLGLDFGDHTVELYGPQIDPLGTLTFGTGTFQPNLDGYGGPQGSASVSVGAPEPAAWTLMLGGFAGLGAAMRGARRRRLPDAAPVGGF